MPATPLPKFGRIEINPTNDRYWIDFNAALLHPLRQIPIADAVLAVPTNTHQHELKSKTTPLEYGSARVTAADSAQLLRSVSGSLFAAQEREQHGLSCIPGAAGLGSPE
jgi:hypothetical protein